MKWKNLVRFGIQAEDIATQLILAFIVLLVFAAAFTRYIGYPINWSVDIAQGLFVWVIYIGANRAWRNSRHIGIDMLFNKMSPQTQRIVTTFVYVLILAFLGSVIVNGIHITIVNSGRILNDIPISYSFVTIAVPAGAFLMLMTTVEKIFRLFVPGGTREGT